MKRIKKFILALLLTKEQRVVILDALNFSLYTYKRRGQIEEAIQVGVVVSDLQKVLTKPKQTYNEKEVQEIVDDTIKHTISKTIDKMSQKFNEMRSKEKENFIEINLDFCETCVEKSKCQVYQDFYNEVTNFIKKNKEPQQDAEEPQQEKTIEQIRAEDDGVNYQKDEQ